MQRESEVIDSNLKAVEQRLGTISGEVEFTSSTLLTPKTLPSKNLRG